jgi:DNA anti-recombination protein RmuC
MAKKKKQKTKTGAGYVEKISSQIFDRIKEELEKSFRVTPSDKINKIKKMLPGLRKQVKKKIKEEFEKSFRLTSPVKIKRGKKTKIKGKGKRQK